MTDGARVDNLVGPVDQGFSVTTLKIYIDSMLADRQRQHEGLRAHYDDLVQSAQIDRVAIRDEITRLFKAAEIQNNLIRTHYDSLIEEYDRRYAARFVASEQAVKDAFAAQEKAINAALAAASAAVNKADVANEKRFDNVNEFRAQLGDQQRTFMPRAEVDVIAKGTTESIASLNTQMRAQVPRTEHDAAIKGLTDKYDALVSRLDRGESRNQGGQQVWGYVVAAAGVLIGVAGVILAIIR